MDRRMLVLSIVGTVTAYAGALAAALWRTR